MPGRILSIGIGSGRWLDNVAHLAVEIIAFPWESVDPRDRKRARIEQPTSLDQALILLRRRYADHGQICTLADTQLMLEGDEPPSAFSRNRAFDRTIWFEAIRRRLGEFFHDLGNCPLDTWAGARNLIANRMRYGDLPTSSDLIGQHQGETAICIASGPSAHHYFDDIRRLRPAVRIFCADSILGALLEHGIVPDYVCMVERDQEIATLIRDHGACGAHLITPLVGHPDSLAPFAGRIVSWIGADDLYHWAYPMSGGRSSGRSAGTMTVSAALLSGCEAIHLVGHDLAYRDGQSHSCLAHPQAAKAHAAALEQRGDHDYHLQRFEVESNSGAPVVSNGLWSIFRSDIEAMIADHPEVRVVNVHTAFEGARIAGAPIGELPWRRMHYVVPRPFTIPAATFARPIASASLRRDIDLLEQGARRLHAVIDEPIDPQTVERVTVTGLVGHENAWLFHYVLRSIFTALKLRLYLRRDQPSAQRDALLVLSATLQGMADTMRRELPC